MSSQETNTGYSAQQVAERFSFKLTSLREQVIALLLDQAKPIKAYDLLAKLKLIRATAKPPTIYRVLDFLVEHKAVIRLEGCNSYILSAMNTVRDAATARMTMVFRDKLNGNCVQFSDPSFDKLVLDWEKEHNVRFNSRVVEFVGESMPEDCR